MRNVEAICLPEVSKLPNLSKCSQQEKQNSSINYKLINSDYSYAIRSNALAGISFKSKYKSAYIEHKLMQILEDDRFRSIPVILKIKPKFISRIAAAVTNNPEQRRVLFVSGLSGSGKTTAIKDAVSELSNNNGVISYLNGDNFFYDISEELKKAGSFDALINSGKNMDIPDVVDLKRMAKTAKRLVKGEQKIMIPYYDYATGGVVDNIIPVTPPNKGGIIIGDTIHGLGPAFSKVRDIGMYVDCPEDVITSRWYGRSAERGRTGKDADTLYKSVMDTANIHIKPYKKNADLVINGLADREDSAATLSQLFKVMAGAK